MVSTQMKPWITVPLGAFGVMVSVMVPFLPGLMVNGEKRALALTLCSQTSPVVEVMAESNGFVLTTAVRFAVPVVPLVNGPVASGKAKNNPGAISDAPYVQQGRAGRDEPAWLAVHRQRERDVAHVQPDQSLQDLADQPRVGEEALCGVAGVGHRDAGLVRVPGSQHPGGRVGCPAAGHRRWGERDFPGERLAEVCTVTEADIQQDQGLPAGRG